MADEIGAMNFEEGWGWVRQDMNKVTEEAVRRVQEDQKKAKQVGQQIQADHAANLKLAKFLWFLVQSIQDEHLIKSLYETFFKVKHPETQVTYLRKTINTPVVVWIFVPFYISEVKDAGLEDIYGQIYDFRAPLSLSNYVSYLKTLSGTYHDNIPLDKSTFLDFLIVLASYYDLIDTAKLSDEARKELKQTLSKELYGS